MTFLRPLPLSVVSVLIALSPASLLHANFTTIYNVPSDSVPFENGFYRVTTSNTQLNLFDGSQFNPRLIAGAHNATNVEVNVFGGAALEIETVFGARLNVSGGATNIRAGGPLSISKGQLSAVSRANDGMMMTGGEILDFFDMGPSAVPYVISGGTIGDFAEITLSTLEMSGGSIGDNFRADRATEIAISGGTVGDNFLAFGSELVTTNIYITGGTIGRNFESSIFTDITIAGGAFGDRMKSVRYLRGSDFRLDGVPIDGLESLGDEVVVDVPQFGNSVLTGTLEDGTPFAFWFGDGDRSSDFVDQLQVTLRRTALPPIVPFRSASTATGPLLGVRVGESLLVDAPLGDHFNAGQGSTVHVAPAGSIGENFEAIAASVLITGGTIGPGFQAFEGATVTVVEGSLQSLALLHDSSAHIHGGSVTGLSGSGHANIHGGGVAFGFRLESAHFFGREFFLDGQRITGLSPGSPLTLDFLAATIFSGTLADGTLFSYSLGSPQTGAFRRLFGTLTVTLVPEPSTIAFMAIATLAIASTRRRFCLST